MHCVLTMPPVYRYWTDLSDGLKPLPKWTNWGWCNAEQMTLMINSHYDLDWTPLELIHRFGIDPKTAVKTKKFWLRILVYRNERYELLNYYPDLLMQLDKDQQFSVPAGWAQEVLWALYGGGRTLQVENHPSGKGITVAVFDGNGNGICYF